MPHLLKPRVPTFVRAADGKWYEDLVYQDHPMRRGWFVVFDSREPAEFVLRESEYKAGIGARDVLEHRGFGACLAHILFGRRDPHKRFFGAPATPGGEPMEGHAAISWFLAFKKGAPLPTPNSYDSCVEIYPYFPNKEGVYFGERQ